MKMNLVPVAILGLIIGVFALIKGYQPHSEEPEKLSGEPPYEYIHVLVDGVHVKDGVPIFRITLLPSGKKLFVRLEQDGE